METLRNEITVQVRHEEDSFWATVVEYPGLFASGHSMDELWESLSDGLAAYLSEQGSEVHKVQLQDIEPEPEVQTIRKTLVSA